MAKAKEKEIDMFDSDNFSFTMSGATVYVEGWKNAREAILSDDSILLQVSPCPGCSTCDRRLVEVGGCLRNLKVAYKSIRTDTGIWLGITMPVGADPGEFLSMVLDRKVTVR